MDTHSQYYLSVEETAKKLGFKGPSNVYKLIKSGQLMCLKRSQRGTLVPIWALEAYQEQFRQVNPSSPTIARLDPTQIDEQVDKFISNHGYNPEQWLEHWNHGEITGDVPVETVLIARGLQCEINQLQMA